MGKKSESESELMDGEADPFDDDSEMNVEEEDGSFPVSSIKNFLILFVQNICTDSLDEEDLDDELDLPQQLQDLSYEEKKKLYVFKKNHNEVSHILMDNSSM